MGARAEGPLTAPGDHHGLNVVSVGQPVQRVVELLGELSGDQVERRVDQLQVGNRPEVQHDELAHDTAPKSAARPIGPVAYSRPSMLCRSTATRGRKPICESTSRSTSIPGATSISTSPSSSSEKTARSVM